MRIMSPAAKPARSEQHTLYHHSSAARRFFFNERGSKSNWSDSLCCRSFIITIKITFVVPSHSNSQNYSSSCDKKQYQCCHRDRHMIIIWCGIMFDHAIVTNPVELGVRLLVKVWQWCIKWQVTHSNGHFLLERLIRVPCASSQTT